MNLHIPTPCHESWDKMTPQKDGRFCATCETVVVDFSNKSLDEIKAYFETTRETNVCGFCQERHVTNSKFYRALNSIELFFSKTRLSKFVIASITFILFVTGCHHNRKMGKMKASTAKNSQDQNKIERVGDMK